MSEALELLSFSSRAEWRSWLTTHHDRATEAWIIIYKKGAREGALAFEHAQDEALCYGWTDVKSKGIDELRYAIRFTPRREGSQWSITNIRRAEELIEAGLMAEAGLEKIAEARQNGQWEAAIRSEQTELIPRDLEKALRRSKGALAGYRSLTHSRKRQLLHALLTAKSEATRQRRIEAIVREAGD